MDKKTWKEFEETGLLWFINTILHMFGWAIVLSYDKNDEIVGVFPARVVWRGYDEHVNDEGYTKVTHYLHDNIDKLVYDVENF